MCVADEIIQQFTPTQATEQTAAGGEDQQFFVPQRDACRMIAVMGVGLCSIAGAF